MQGYNANINKVPIELSFDLSKGNYIKDVYYEKETDKAIKIVNEEQDKYSWIPKSIVKGGWIKDYNKLQNIYLRFGIRELYWFENS